MRAKLLAAAVLPAALGTGLFATAAFGDPTPTPTATPSVSPSVSPTPSPTATPQPTEAAPVAPGETPTTPVTPKPEETCPEVPQDTSGISKKEAVELYKLWQKNKCETPQKRKAARGGLSEATYTEDVTLTADFMEQKGLSYDGVATLPTKSGSIKVLKFSMDGATLKNLVQKTSRSTLRTERLEFAGDVTMYATKLEAKAFGLLPLTLTPDAPPPLVLPWMTFTDVTVDHTVVVADSATASGLAQR